MIYSSDAWTRQRSKAARLTHRPVTFNALHLDPMKSAIASLGHRSRYSIGYRLHDSQRTLTTKCSLINTLSAQSDPCTERALFI